MVINLRGTSGAGKSTIVRSVMERYPSKTPQYLDGRRQPINYLLSRTPPFPGNPVLWNPESRQLFIPGHYETPCGGCDTIERVDDVYSLVTNAALQGFDVLFEGIMVQDDVKRAVNFDNRIGKLLVICLTAVPLETCLAGIQARRDERGDVRPLDPRNTIARAKRVVMNARRLRAGGVEVIETDRDGALNEVLKRLGLVDAQA